MMQSQVRPHQMVVLELPLLHERGPLPESPDALAAAAGVGGELREAGWLGQVPGRPEPEEEYVVVRPVHPVDWPAGAEVCVEVWYFLPVEHRGVVPGVRSGQSLEAAEHRVERVEALIADLRGLGYEVAFVDRKWLGMNLLAYRVAGSGEGEGFS